MNVNQLFQLAKDNSKVAVKKFERQSAKRGGIDSFNVSNAAISKFLSKQQKQKEQQQAEENLARQQRIKARLVANTVKKNINVKSQQQKQADALKKKQAEDNLRFKVDKIFKKDEKNKILKKDDIRKAEKGNIKKDKIKHSKESKQRLENQHRKEIDRTMNKSIKTSVTQKSKSTKNSGTTSSVNFEDLMKMAKTNSTNALKKDDPHRLNVKRAAPLPEIKKHKQQQFDPDRNIKVKMHHKEEIRKTNNPPPMKKKPNKEFDARAIKLQSKMKSQEKLNTTNNNKSKPKCSLVAETVSQKISQAYKQVKPYHREGGIAAQNIKSAKYPKKMKKDIKNYDDEFDKEERDLMRRRKLFEMQRITGNRDMDEADLFYDEEDEEYDEEDDFIDDTETTINPSKYIRQIFGYDRRKFDESDDDDLSNMEASYSQIEKEEQRSARIAKIEDEYEAMKEEEELRRLKSKKKR